VPRFLRRFEDVYSRLGKTETILATAAAHHRLAWIHLFVDGNGRVVRPTRDILPPATRRAATISTAGAI
jgi:hypothetical protein